MPAVRDGVGRRSANGDHQARTAALPASRESRGGDRRWIIFRWPSPADAALHGRTAQGGMAMPSERIPTVLRRRTVRPLPSQRPAGHHGRGLPPPLFGLAFVLVNAHGGAGSTTLCRLLDPESTGRVVAYRQGTV